MKGSEIRKLWEKARDAVIAVNGTPGGEIGDRIRARGYDIVLDGGSVCKFKERRLDIYYSADCYENPWRICGLANVYDGQARKEQIAMTEANERYFGKFDPDREYEVAEWLSEAEKFDRGLLDCGNGFEVVDDGPKTTKVVGEFKDFEKADECAREKCEQEIARLNKDPTWRRHTPLGVRNYELYAREMGYLRLYLDYDCNGYRYWIAVRRKK